MHYDDLDEDNVELLNKKVEQIVRIHEDKISKAQTKQEIDKEMYAAESTIRAMEFVNLIKAAQANQHRKRFEKLQKDFEDLETRETRDIVNSYENHLEIAKRYQNMDNYNKVIRAEKAERTKQNQERDR